MHATFHLITTDECRVTKAPTSHYITNFPVVKPNSFALLANSWSTLVFVIELPASIWQNAINNLLIWFPLDSRPAGSRALMEKIPNNV